MQMLPINQLKPYPLSTTYLVRSDFRSLSESVRQFGLMNPIVVRESTNEVIDGKYRLSILHSAGVKEVPCTVVDLSEDASMVLHIQLNRYRSEVIAKDLSGLIQRLVDSGVYSEDQLMVQLGMTADEFNILESGTLIRQRNIPEHTYSKAWVPVESDSAEDFKIERPTGRPEQPK